MSFHFLLESGNGAILLENGGYLLLENAINPPAPGVVARVRAVAAGYLLGDWKDIGDVFDITDTSQFSDSTQSQVPLGNPDYPVLGWMLIVPSTTPLFSWASTGLSSPRSGPRRTVE